MKRKIYAISLLLSFLLVLSHQVISHHHHDMTTYDFSFSHKEVDEHEHHSKHHHQHDYHEKNDSEKYSNKKHNHPFSLHHHVSATDDFDCTRVNFQELNSYNQSIKIFTGLYIFHKEYSELPNLNNYNFGDPPFLINFLFEPGAIALRGPPSIG